MDCTTARQLMAFTRPGELPELDLQALHAHCRGCAACAAVNSERTAWDQRIGTAMKAVPVPAQLRERIHTRLRRDRRCAARKRLSRIVTIAASLLAVLLAYGVAQRWRLAHPSALDLETVGIEIAQQHTEGQVRDWLARHGAATLPVPLELTYLAFYGVVNFRGEPTPMLHLTRNTGHGVAHAQVYLVPSERYDWRQTPTGQAVPTSHNTVEVRTQPGSKITLVVVVSGEANLEQFLRPEQPL